MKNTTTYLLLIPILLISSIIMIHPVVASDGQYIDHILLFELPTSQHSFNLTLEKNQKYEFICELYSPGVEADLAVRLIGPDGDGDGFDDGFWLGAGILGDKEASVSALFGCAITGNYTVTVMANVDKNANIRFVIHHKGNSYSGEAVLYDVSGFYDTKERLYWFDLKDDTRYTLTASRTNSIPGNTTIWDDNAEVDGRYNAFVTVSLFDDQDRRFDMCTDIELENVYGTESASVSFGMSFKGEYKMSVTVTTNYETVNIMMVLKEGSNIGDGPEDDPVEPETNSTTPQQQFTVSVPKWTFGVVFAGGMVFVLIAVAVSRERSMKNIIR